MDKIYIDAELKKADQKAYTELVNTLRMGVDVVEWLKEWGDPPDDGVCYIGFAAPLPNPQCCYHLPILPSEMYALNALILAFALGFIPTEIRAFRADDDIVSKMRL